MSSATIVFSLILLIIIFVLVSGLGTIIVKRNQYFSENSFLILPIGFLVFFAITFLTYLPLIIVGANLIILAVFELLKDLLITYYVFFYIGLHLKSWYRFIIKIFFPILIIAIFVLFIQWLSTNNNDVANQVGFNGWVKFNSNNFTFNNYNWFTGIQKYRYASDFFSQTWYYFNALIIMAFPINLNVMMFWVDGITILCFAVSTVTSLFHFINRKLVFCNYFFTIVVVLFINFLINHNLPAIVGSLGACYCFIVAIIFLLYYSKFSNKKIVAWFNWCCITSWSFSNDVILLWLAFYFAFFIYIVFDKKQNIPETILIIIPTLILIFGFRSFYSFPIIFTILFVICLVLFLTNWTTRYWSGTLIQKIDFKLYKNKLYFVISPFLLFFAISMFYLISGKVGSWLEFGGPSAIGLDYETANRSNIVPWLIYAFYWVFLLALLVIIFFSKNLNFFTVGKPFVFISFICAIIFYNPLVSGFLNSDSLFSKNEFLSLRIVFFLPVFLGLCSLIVKKININWVFAIGNLAAIASSVIPIALNVNVISSNSFANPTASKGISKVASYLNSIINLPLYIKIDGDVKGLRALTNIGFVDKIQDDLLFYNTNLYSQFFEDHPEYNLNSSNPNRKDLYILVKLRTNVFAVPGSKNNFNATSSIEQIKNYRTYGFETLVDTIENYYIYLPFQPTIN